jgi:hypothetical protein
MGAAILGFAWLVLGVRLARVVGPGRVVECRNGNSHGPYISVTLSTAERLVLRFDDIERDRCTTRMFRLEKRWGALDFVVDGASIEWGHRASLMIAQPVGGGLVVAGVVMMLIDRRRRGRL